MAVKALTIGTGGNLVEASVQDVITFGTGVAASLTHAANTASGPLVLDSAGKIPALDGSQITGIAGGGGSVTVNVPLTGSGTSASHLAVSYDSFTIVLSAANALAVADRVEANELLMGILSAKAGSTAAYALVNGWLDGFSDQSGVDTGSSSNQSYDSGNKLYKPTVSGTTNIQVCVIAGGGGGGGALAAGGGGSGGLVYNSAFAVSPTSYTVTIGPGGGGGSGYAVGTNGTDSVFGSITATGGGGGGKGVVDAGHQPTSGVGGGSGGGGGGETGTVVCSGGSGVAGQGYHGGANYRSGNPYSGGGGGGAGAVGSDGSSGSTTGGGGVGIANPITGSTSGQNVGGTYYLAGGGGAGGTVDGDANGGAGGNGGGAAGGTKNSSGGSNGYDATANTGGGGGGAGAGASNLRSGGAGGSGIVIVRYLTGSITATGGTITTSGSYTIHTFTSSGTFTVTSGGTPQNVTLISTAAAAAATTNTVRIVVLEEDVDAITLNTDLIASVSANGGTNWTAATLTSEGNYATGKRVLSAVVDVSSHAGTSLKWKLVTANNKNLKLHGVGLVWQ